MIFGKNMNLFKNKNSVCAKHSKKSRAKICFFESTFKNYVNELLTKNMEDENFNPQKK